MSDNDIPVVVVTEAEENAYQMGYERFTHEPNEPHDDMWFSHYTESAEWANSKLPKLRAMAGAKDSMGHGTYTEHQEVVVVEEPRDRPMSGELTDSRHIHEKLVELFRYGAEDKIDGNDPDVTRWV